MNFALNLIIVAYKMTTVYSPRRTIKQFKIGNVGKLSNKILEQWGQMEQ